MRRRLRWLLLVPSASGIALCLAALSYGAAAPAGALAMYSRQAAAMSLRAPSPPQASQEQDHALLVRSVTRLQLRAARIEQRADRRMWAEHRADVAAAAAARAAAAAQAAQATAPSAAAPYVSVSGVGGAFGACVRAAENGGSYSWGTGNGGGAYQFLPSTWAKYAPAGAVYGLAGPAEQDQAFMNAISTSGGYLNWSPYDGCWP